ncbi:MAG: GSCFA domain-containing protein [Chitinophagales bacterium]
MNFRTEINIPPSLQKITHRSKSLFIGSCFTENIGNQMQKLKFTSMVNPFGILYNPLSINTCLQRLLTKKPFTTKELHHFNEQWHSWEHHGRFSDSDPNQCLKDIHQEQNSASDFLKQADYLLLTLGTAFVYQWKESGQIVANCHKIPQKQFEHYRVSTSEIVNTLLPTLQQIQEINPQLQIIFTLSPIRHWKNGAIDNQISKASLLVAIHELKAKLKNAHYFPAYEIMMDDLRDYRFYESDMLHPTSMAIDYIWEKFQGVYLGEKTKQLMLQVKKILNAKNHRPRNPKSEAHQKFLQKQLRQIEALEKRHSFLNFEVEKRYFREAMILN